MLKRSGGLILFIKPINGIVLFFGCAIIQVLKQTTSLTEREKQK